MPGAVYRRRAVFVLIVALVAATLVFLMVRTLAPGGWTLAKGAMFLSCLGAAPWVGFCTANGIAGFLLCLSRPAVPKPEPAPSGNSRVAIAITVRNEDMTRVLLALRRLLDGLEGAGAGSRFGVFVLSDSSSADLGAAEADAVARFAANDPRPERVHYRRRAENTNFKAGNIMEFLDHGAGGYDFLLPLDADSEMTADAVFRLLGMMERDPSLGIAQHLTVGLPAPSIFPRLFQFGMRAGMRIWATSLAWWQDDACVYWGHNALIRIVPFRDHCKLPPLPDGTPILSHDQVEAAVLRGAGWGIRLLPEEAGSYEQNPPALPEFMRRELRWLAGNFEYRHLLGLPGLRPMGRWQLMQAILLFGCTPFYLVFLLAGAAAAATDRVSPFPFRWAMAATLVWAGGLYAPKLLGYAEVLLSADKRNRYGGTACFLRGAAAETVFTLLLDAINTWAKSIATARIFLGWRASWPPQNRDARGVPWAEAARLLWPQTLLGLIAFAGFASAGWTAVLWALPFAGGLLVAIPFCVITSRADVGAWAARRKIGAIPEELDVAP